MRTILVLNAKGGCGKSTISTNLASYFAHEMGKKVVQYSYTQLTLPTTDVLCRSRG